MKQYPNLDKRQLRVMRWGWCTWTFNKLQSKLYFSITDFISKYAPGTLPFVVTNDMGGRDLCVPTNKRPHVYILLSETLIVYIGRTCNIEQRLGFHVKTKDFTHAIIYELGSFEQIVDIELKLVREFHPALNIQLCYPQYGKA